MSRRFDRRVRFVLAALMLLTGLLGQAGHDRAHAEAEVRHAWTSAMAAERAWLTEAALTDGSSDSSVQIFAGGADHSHHGRPGQQQDGPDGLPIDHVHAVVFLMPPGAATAIRGRLEVTYSPPLIYVPASPPDSPDRPPRNV